jgi:serine/threonine-protein kinase
MAYPVGQQLGSYRLIRLLGRGGEAAVYPGEHVDVTGIQAAIKVRSDQYTDAEVQRFCNEFSPIFRLVHPHNVRVLDFGVEGRIPFVVIDYGYSPAFRTSG